MTTDNNDGQNKQQDSRQMPEFHYTSPPTALALAATPESFRSNSVIDEARQTAAAGKCSSQNQSTFCQIPFEPSTNADSKVGVLLYPGALIDPRAYSPLAQTLTERYGLPVVIPIFHQDTPFAFKSPCDTGRLALAEAQFPHVETWILAGHSMGGVAATSDAWNALSKAQTKPPPTTPTTPTTTTTTTTKSKIGGLVLMAADVQSVGCGDTDFSNTKFPMALVTASHDKILNMTRWENNRQLTSDSTLFVEVKGGNHQQFASYNDSGRSEVLGQEDGVPTISPVSQWDITAAAIYYVASQTTTTTTEPVMTLNSYSVALEEKMTLPEEVFHNNKEVGQSWFRTTSAQSDVSISATIPPTTTLDASSSWWLYGMLFLCWLGRKA